MRNTSTIFSHYNPVSLNWEYTIERQDSLNPVSYRPLTGTDSLVSTGHSFRPAIHEKEEQDILGPLLYTVVFLIVFAFIRLRSKDLVITLLSAVVSQKKTELILNEGITSNLLYYILALFLSFSVLSVGGIYFVTGEFMLRYSFWIFCGLVFYHFFELSLIRIFGWTFNSRYISDEAAVNLWTFNIMTGLLVAPLIIAVFFVKAFSVTVVIKIAVFCLIFLFVVKFLRWLQILFIHRVSIFYIILYLCALEIMPLLILYRLVA